MQCQGCIGAIAVTTQAYTLCIAEQLSGQLLVVFFLLPSIEQQVLDFIALDGPVKLDRVKPVALSQLSHMPREQNLHGNRPFQAWMFLW